MDKNEYILNEKYKNEKIPVREYQIELLKIMDEIHKICVKYKIEYALIAGSALGICNYKGFIPWDDDIDICVSKKDWNRFIKALDKDLDEDYYYHCFEKDNKYNVLIPSMKIRKKNTYVEEENFLLRNKCEGNGIFIDVVIYDNVSDSKFIEELYRTPIKLLMPIMVLLDNLKISTKFFKKIVLKISNYYGDRYKNSKKVSQTIAIPWEKFLHEPVFLKEDVYPFKLYEFEGRQYYSYNNIEKVLKEWYGPNCLKKWNGSEMVETLPIEKRQPKHIKYVNLKTDKPSCYLDKMLKKKKVLMGATISLILLIISLILFNDFSFPFLGLAVVFIGITLLQIIK